MKIENCKLKIAKHDAFTLIEIMVAIAIVGIMAAVVLVSMNSFGAKARASRALAQATSVIPAMVSCAGNSGTPAFSGDICSLGSGYGSWPTFPTGYAVDNEDGDHDWTSASSWHFSVTGESQTICCNSVMNSCGIISGTCQDATW